MDCEVAVTRATQCRSTPRRAPSILLSTIFVAAAAAVAIFIAAQRLEPELHEGRSLRALRALRGGGQAERIAPPAAPRRSTNEEEEEEEPPGGFASRGHGVTRSFRTPSRKGTDLEELGEPEALVAISDRSEFLNKTVQRSYSLKSPRPIAKIDTKLYTSAVEQSAVRGSGRVVRPLAVEVPLPADSVALRKSLFERGDVASPTSPRGNPTRDVSGLNVGIASRISQWSNKNEEGTAKGSAARPSDIRPGDVSTKKSIWESKPSAGSPPEKSAAAPSKGNPSGKRFKFVMVAPGKYEKVPIDSAAGDNHFANGGGSEHEESEQ
ncbi:caldesmon, smooth muscle-like [Lethenteron reissneri]|uniref:caldesmon, smooth muscle-like n=1 Tax=Lethenteron reissneri TaxID=7753 RepID=UPI002AB784F9|nr:caldesmon, smooth muscle-like [Lethenteron reissneri]